MDGAIRTRDILTHPIATIRCFGWRIFFRAVTARRNQTFLALLGEMDFFRQLPVPIPKLVARCVDLELRAKRIYELFAWRFAREPVNARFFGALVEHEQQHADLLELCQVAGARGHWKEEYFTPWRDSVPRAEQVMDAAEKAAAAVTTLEKALQVVLQVETSEINAVRDGVFAATAAEFVRNLAAFRNATRDHMTLICRQHPALETTLRKTPVCTTPADGRS